MIEYSNKRLNEKYYKLTHKSGLDIFVFPKKLSSAYAMFGTKYGSIDNVFRLKGEKDFTTVPDGIAHYLEHRMFTQKDGSDITERFSEVGADSNAYTSHNKTVYLCSATEGMEEAFYHLLNFVTEPNFTEELVEKERGIIIQEIKMSDDSPYSRVYTALLEAMYKHNSVRVDIAGTVESVSQITAEMLNKCYDTFYNPANMVAVVCGDVDPQKILEVADRALPDSFKAKEIERKYCESEPAEVNESLKKCYMQVSKPIFTIGVKDVDISESAEIRTRKFAAMSLLSDMLFSKSGELYNTLIDEGRVLPDFYASYNMSEQFAYLIISGESDDPDGVLQYIKSYISSYKLDEAAFERSKRAIYADFVMGFDSTDEIANNLMDFIFEGIDMFAYGETLLDVKIEEIDALLKEFFKDEYFSTSVVYPLESERS